MWTWHVANPIAAHGYGHRTFKFPTTMGRRTTAPFDPDARYYIKDFAMAAGTDSGGNGIADLPYGYGDAGSAPNPPRNLGIRH